jgi:hypothetical protein
MSQASATKGIRPSPCFKRPPWRLPSSRECSLTPSRPHALTPSRPRALEPSSPRALEPSRIHALVRLVRQSSAPTDSCGHRGSSGPRYSSARRDSTLRRYSAACERIAPLRSAYAPGGKAALFGEGRVGVRACVRSSGASRRAGMVKVCAPRDDAGYTGSLPPACLCPYGAATHRALRPLAPTVACRLCPLVSAARREWQRQSRGARNSRALGIHERWAFTRVRLSRGFDFREGSTFTRVRQSLGVGMRAGVRIRHGSACARVRRFS